MISNADGTRECPACGLEVLCTRRGEVYNHEDIINCNYKGNVAPRKMGFFPMNFEYRPLINLTAAYMADETAGTIRLGDPTHLDGASRITIRTADEDVVGVGTVKEIIGGDVPTVYKMVTTSAARYPIANVDELVERLNEYYEIEVTRDTEVFGLVFKPNLSGHPR